MDKPGTLISTMSLGIKLLSALKEMVLVFVSMTHIYEVSISSR